MFNTYRLIGGSLFVLVLFITALAQENRESVETAREPVAAGPLVTAAATSKRVRFVSPGTVVQLRLEVYNETGQKLFDTELHGGNVMDWNLQDGAGQRLPPGAYACVLTIKSLSGRLSQRVGLVRVNDHEAVIEVAGGAKLSTAQQQTIGPVEGNTPFAVLQESEAEAITAVTHDGVDGQMTSTTGALTFRTGDLFVGKDVERMRITPEGNVGIGTDKPEATLDVAGAVRATEGFRFSDGTTLDAAGGKIALRDAAGNALPSPAAAGTGTLNQLAKWTETGGAGTLGDSALFESGGQLGVGTSSPNSNAVVHADRSQNAGTALFVTNNNAGTGALASMRTGLNPANFAADYASLNILGANWPAGFGGPVLKGKTVLLEGAGSNFGIGNINASEPIQFYTTGSRLERMRITSAGDVGIGTTNPAAKLDVAGTINTSRQYNIDGKRILSIAGTDNLFAGTDAGTSNSTGIFNAFFGILSGTSNTTGFSNSFFGVTSGTANTTGSNNSFFGVRAGNANTTGGSNSFFGLNAGLHNTTASNNSFFGAFAGVSNTIGSSNAFFGFQAGQSNLLGGRDSFFGFGAGSLNVAGARNSFFGTEAGMSNNGQDNSFFGDKAGMLNAQGILNTFIGAGAAEANTTGSNNTALGAQTVIPEGASFATVIGAGAVPDQSGDNSVTLGRSVDEVHIPGSLHLFRGRELPTDDLRFTTSGAGRFGGTIELGMLGTVGAEALCRNVGTHKIALCSSSLRYKTEILPFRSGLSLVNRLQPISFTWKEAGNRDLGLGAEDVEKIEPLLVTYNDKGEVEGVKYDRVAVVLLNAVKEQQDLITKQNQQLKQQQSATLKQQHKLEQEQRRVEQQQQQLDALRKLVCRNNPRAKACK